MKMNVRGFELSNITGKDGKTFQMVNVHCEIPLSAPTRAGDVAKGFISSAYRATPEVVASIAHLEPPFVAELETSDVQLFGKRQTVVTAIRALAAEVKRGAA